VARRCYCWPEGRLRHFGQDDTRSPDETAAWRARLGNPPRLALKAALRGKAAGHPFPERATGTNQSSKRRFEIFSTMLAATVDVSSCPTPSKIKSPVAISPVTLPSAVTRARLTRGTTARIVSLKNFRWWRVSAAECVATRSSAVNRQDASQLSSARCARCQLPTCDKAFDLTSFFRLPRPPQRLGRHRARVLHS
jgi:hypothetical protein